MPYEVRYDTPSIAGRAAEAAGALYARRQNLLNTFGQLHQSAMQGADIAANQQNQAFQAQQHAVQSELNRQATLRQQQLNNQFDLAKQRQYVELQGGLQAAHDQAASQMNALDNHRMIVQQMLKDGTAEYDPQTLQKINELTTAGVKTLNDPTIPDDIRRQQAGKLFAAAGQLQLAPRFKVKNPTPDFDQVVKQRLTLLDPRGNTYQLGDPNAPPDAALVTVDRSGTPKPYVKPATPKQSPQTPAEYLLAPERAADTFSTWGKRIYDENKNRHDAAIAEQKAKIAAAEAQAKAIADARDENNAFDPEYKKRLAEAQQAVVDAHKDLSIIYRNQPNYPSQEDIKRRIYTDIPSWGAPLQPQGVPPGIAAPPPPQSFSGGLMQNIANRQPAAVPPAPLPAAANPPSAPSPHPTQLRSLSELDAAPPGTYVVDGVVYQKD